MNNSKSYDETQYTKWNKNNDKKEILNKLLKYFKESNINDFGYEQDQLISYEEAQILLDCITNLQEENKNLKEWLNNVCFDGWNENVELALRYLLRIGYISFDEKTKEYINHNINDPICFGEEGKKYNDLLDKLDLENQDYKSKNEKAIEYIKRCRDYHKTYHNEDKMFPDELTSLIIILQGDDE